MSGSDRSMGPAMSRRDGGTRTVADAFATLGFSRRLSLSADEVRERFHEASRALHPDVAGGGEREAFECLNEAQSILSDPARRARHWLELECGGIDASEGAAGSGGAIDPRLMDLFAVVGGVIRAADEVVAKCRGARSPLARALLEREVLAAHQEVAGALARVGEAIAAGESRLAEADAAAASGDLAGAADLALRGYRELAFLGKWRGQLQERFGLLFG